MKLPQMTHLQIQRVKWRKKFKPATATLTMVLRRMKNLKNLHHRPPQVGPHAILLVLNDDILSIFSFCLAHCLYFPLFLNHPTQNRHQNPTRKNHTPAQAQAPLLLPSFLRMKPHLHTLSRRRCQTRKISQLQLNPPPRLILILHCLSQRLTSPLKLRTTMTHQVHPHQPTTPTKRPPRKVNHPRTTLKIHQRQTCLSET